MNKQTLSILAVFCFALALSAGSALAATGDWSRERPNGAIVDFVNSLASQYGYAQVPESLHYDSATALKVCQLAGFDAVESMDCHANYGNSQCGWTSPHNNTMTRWDTSTNNFITQNAVTMGNKWLATLKCKNNAPVVCNPNWQVGAWGACVNGQQTRTVTDSNNCGVTTNRPDSTQSCVSGLAVSCYGTPNPANVGQQVSYISSVTGGAAPYTYSWTGACLGSSQICSNLFTDAGNRMATITVRSGTEDASANCSIGVNQNCSHHASQRCVGNNLTYFDSCGNAEDYIANGCLTQNIACSSDSQCGNSGYIGSPYCGSNGDVYQTYRTHTCNNPGTTSSSCSTADDNRLKTNCDSNQTCSAGSCNQTQNCSAHSYQQCNGNYLYWYNSCGQQEDSQYCPNGCSGNYCQQNSNNISAQTNPATNINNNQATLNGYLSGVNNNNGSTNVWFQWGTSSSYGNETSHQSQNSSGSFNQSISNLSSNNTYHFRAVAQTANGNIVSGQDMTFWTGSSLGSTLTVGKTVRNLTSGNTGWSSTVYASPLDVLMFMITVQNTGSQNINNVFVRDIFPSNLIYRNQLIVSGSNNYNNSGDIVSGINLGTISGGQTVTITYQAQLASAQNFSFGTSNLTNSVSVSSSDSGYNPTSNASIVVTRTAVLGATLISTGLTNNILTDSFILPLMIALLGLWMFKAGAFGGVEKWLSQKKLNSKIEQIRRTENI